MKQLTRKRAPPRHRSHSHRGLVEHHSWRRRDIAESRASPRRPPVNYMPEIIIEALKRYTRSSTCARPVWRKGIGHPDTICDAGRAGFGGYWVTSASWPASGSTAFAAGSFMLLAREHKPLGLGLRRVTDRCRSRSHRLLARKNIRQLRRTAMLGFLPSAQACVCKVSEYASNQIATQSGLDEGPAKPFVAMW